jgi:hypothetical protein
MKKAGKEKSDRYRGRLIEVKTMRAGDVAPHPNNPRLHPPSQMEPLRGLLEEVGKAGTLSAYYSKRNGGKLTYWDGHGRRDSGPDELWPVAIYDLTDEEVDLLLVSHDEITLLAERDARLQSQLLANLQAEDHALDALLDQLRLDAQAAADSDGGETRENGARRLTASKNQTVKAVIVARQAAIIECALIATGLRNRGEALTEVCREYLLAKGQLDIFEQEEIAAETA